MAQPRYYNNPAFCQQSEFVNRRALSPVRQSPIGAQTSLRILDTSICDQPEDDLVEEQEFYEEMLVDDTGIITEKKFVVVSQDLDGRKYLQVPQQDPVRSPNPKNRYEYIPMQEKTIKNNGNKLTPKKNIGEIEVVPDSGTGRIHRYAVIQPEEETELTNTKEKYALVPVKELNNVVVPAANQNRYEYIESPKRQQHRYEYVQNIQSPQRTEQKRIQPNPAATAKLHEILSTPKKVPLPTRLKLSPIAKEQFQSPRTRTPKAQQRLNYALGTQQLQLQDKRHTAIVTPMCSSPIQSVSETTFSNSFNLSASKASAEGSLKLAAFVMLVCGGLTSGLSFYMMMYLGRVYYLDFSVLAGFTCLILGLLGFRQRNVYWLPNRKYIAGYMVLSVFSFTTCLGLLVLLVKQPKAGTPLADMTSGAVCGISGFSLLLAIVGVVTSYCCKFPPPDNRVQHLPPTLRV